jgi:hypothetical protein
VRGILNAAVTMTAEVLRRKAARQRVQASAIAPCFSGRPRAALLRFDLEAPLIDQIQQQPPPTIWSCPLMLSRLATVVGLLAAAAPVAHAAEEPKSYACTFSVGAAFSYEGGTYKPEKVGPITFDISTINPEMQSADLVTPVGSRPLRVVRAVNALHFLEVVGEGFLNMTTVYDRDDAKGTHPAVHSRHFGVLGQPVIGQYQGFCHGK